MTYLVALALILSLPIFITLLRGQPRYRAWAFTAIGLLPFLTNVTTTGFLYGSFGWNGTVRGFAISLILVIGIALLVTQRRIDIKLPFLPIFLLYGFSLIFSVFFSSVRPPALFVCWQFFCVLFVFAAVATEGHIPKFKNAIMSGFALGLIYQAIFVIIEKLEGVVQAKGTMVHQNILGLVSELVVLPLLGAVLGGDRRPIVLAGIVAALICIAGSGSRGTLGIAGGAIILLAITSLIRNANGRKFGMVALGAVALAAITPFAIGTLNDRFKGGTFVTEETERKSFENMALAMAQDHPFGVGANQFVFVSNRDGYAARAGVAWQQANRSIPVHNAYLLARAETGWLGQVSFIIILIFPMIVAFWLAFKDRKSQFGELILGCAVALVAIIVHNNYEFAIHTVDVQALLFINLGIIAAGKRFYVTNTHTKKQRKTSTQMVEPRSMASTMNS